MQLHTKMLIICSTHIICTIKWYDMDSEFTQLHILSVSHEDEFAHVHDDVTPQHFHINIFKNTEQIDSSMFHLNTHTQSYLVHNEVTQVL